MSKKTRTVSLNPHLNEYLRTNVSNVSGFIDETLTALLENGIRDGDEWKTADVRARILRMHLSVVEKEIAELQRQQRVLERALDDYEDDSKVIWDVDLDEIYRRERAGRPAKDDNEP